MDFLARIRTEIDTASVDQAAARVRAAFEEIRAAAQEALRAPTPDLGGLREAFRSVQSAGEARVAAAASSDPAAAGRLRAELSTLTAEFGRAIRSLAPIARSELGKALSPAELRAEAGTPRLRSAPSANAPIDVEDDPVRRATAAHLYQAEDLTRRAADNEYLRATVELATARKLLAAFQHEELAADRAYLQASTDSATAKARLAAGEAEARAADATYIDATVRVARARDVLAATEARARTADPTAIGAGADRRLAEERLRRAEESATLARTTPGDITGRAGLELDRERERVARSLEVERQRTDDDIRAAGELAAARRRAAVATQRSQLSASAGDVGSEATLAVENRLRAAARSLAEAQAAQTAVGVAGASYAETLGTAKAAQAALTAQINRIAAQTRSADPTFIADQAATSRLNAIQNQKVRLAELGLVELAGETEAERLARIAVAERVQTEQRRLAEVRQMASIEDGEARLIVERRVAEREYNRVLNRRIQAEINERAERGDPGFRGSVTQRVQAYISQRSGGTPRLETEFLKLPQLLSSRLLTTAGFALSGAALYGVIGGIHQIVTEAEELQRQLAAVKGQFESTFGADADRLFTKFRSDIISIAKETGAAPSEVAFVSRQLVGVFHDPRTDQPDPARATREARSAFRLAQVTGLDPKEINDSLTAINVAFGTTFKRIGDLSIALENRLGVLSSETIKFTADLAPLAAGLGFTADELATLGAVAQQVSGRAGAALAEQLGRSFAGLQENAADVISLYTSVPALAGQKAEEIAGAFARGDISDVFKRLLADYNQLGKAQRIDLVEKLGGPRQASAVIAVLERGPVALEEIERAGTDATGSLDRRFDEFSKTVSLSFQRVRRTVEEFGLALFNSGLSDLLRDAADDLASVVEAGSALLRVVSDLNQALGGLPGRIVALAVIARILSAIASSGRVAGVGTALSTLFGRGGAVTGGGAGQLALPFAAATGPGAFLSRYGPGLAPVAAIGASAAGGGLAGRGDLWGLLGGLGAVGGGLGGLRAAGLLSPPVAALSAAILSAQALSKLQQVRTQGRQQTNDFSDKLSKLSDAQLREAARTVADQGASLVDKLAIGLRGNKTPVQYVADEEQKRGAGGLIAQLRVIRNERNARFERLVTSDAGIDDLIKQLKADPKSDLANTGASQVIAAARQQLPRLRQHLDKVKTDSAKRRQAIDSLNTAIDTSATAGQTIAQLFADYQAGHGGYDAFHKAITREIAIIEKSINDAKQKGVASPAGYIDQLDTLKKLSAQGDALMRTRVRDFDLLLTQFGAGTPGETNEAAAARHAVVRLADLDLLSPEDQIAALREVLTAEQAAFDRQFAEAKSAADKLALLARGQTNPAVQRAALIAQFRQTGAGLVGNILGKILPDAALPQVAGDVDKLRADKEAVRQEQLREDLAFIDLARARNEGDPIGDALADIRVADTRLEAAITASKTPGAAGGNKADIAEARAARERAATALREAEEARLSAQLDLAAALAGSDPIDQARIAQQRADLAARTARGAAAQLEAQAARVAADRQMQEAVAQLGQAQLDLAQAMAEAADDTVGAARIGVQKLQDQLGTLLSRPHGQAEENELRAQLITAQANLVRTTISDATDRIDTDLQLERISRAEAVRQLRALEAVATTQHQRDQLELKIHALLRQANQDLQFDVPADLRLPTLYEARRFREAGQLGQGYQDSRTVHVSITNNDAQDYQRSIQMMTDLLTRPPRVGLRPNAYT